MKRVKLSSKPVVAAEKISLDSLKLQTVRKVVGISCDSGVIKSSEMIRGEENDEFSDLPLTDFEKNMQRLQHVDDGEQTYTSIIQRLEDNYTQERESIYQSGYKAGIEAGRQESEQRYRKDLQAFESLIHEIKESRWRLRKEAELSMLQLVVQIAERVIATSISIDESKILDIIREAMQMTNESEITKITLNTEDYEYVLERSELLNELPESVELVKDRTVTRGGCIIGTNMETIDARIETKLNQLTEELYINMTDQED
ncbi:MAG: hypothetical protein GF372_01060 [Candidatus Marinimicrobia bacterium]|nr:hypothetical protein [Candidatus Neomarinimicrobiota bacterium]